MSAEKGNSKYAEIITNNRSGDDNASSDLSLELLCSTIKFSEMSE